eukprot:GFYU01003946.1.p1 GENE.GFYU01003946.1~~GFYU01003946.1.p1  ORF type:complete len:1089 (+),score=230.13 GFYU01003946.1:255-3521(+)
MSTCPAGPVLAGPRRRCGRQLLADPGRQHLALAVVVVALTLLECASSQGVPGSAGNPMQPIIAMWTKAHQYGSLPPLSCDHSAVKLKTTHVDLSHGHTPHHMLVMHGYNEDDQHMILNDKVYQADVDPQNLDVQWSEFPTQLAPGSNATGLAASPLQRLAASAGMYERNRTEHVWIHGGDGDDYFRDVWTLNVETGVWTEQYANDLPIDNTARPAPRGYTDVSWTSGAEQPAERTNLFMFGGSGTLDGVTGSDLDKGLDDMWLYNVDTQAWKVVLNATGEKPPGLDGHRTCVVGRTLYLFGGYKCTEKGIANKSGAQCYSNDMYIMDLDTWRWRRVDPSRSEQPPPLRRAYHSMTVVGDKLWIFGGGYVDHLGDWVFYNDIGLFDITNELWLPVEARGTPPQVRWSHTATNLDSDIFIFGGCTTKRRFYNDMWVLKTENAISWLNILPYGTGLTEFKSGERAYVYVDVVDYTLNNNTWHAGKTLKWATGLDPWLRLFLVGNHVLLASGAPVDLGEGQYRFEYFMRQGPELSLWVEFDNTHVLGSPFVSSVIAAEQTGKYSVVQGYGTTIAVQGQTSHLTIHGYDPYENRAMVGGAYITALLETVDKDIELLLEGFQVTDFNNGTYAAQFTTPMNVDEYLLTVYVNSDPTGASPYRVTVYKPAEVPLAAKVATILVFVITMLMAFLYSLFVWRNRNHAVIAASSPPFVLLIIAGSVLASLCLVLMIETNDVTCALLPFTLGLGVTLTFAGLISKNWRIMRIFQNKSSRVVVIKNHHLSIPVIAIVGVEILINFVWLMVDPVSAEIEIHKDVPILEHTQCDGNNSLVWLGTSFAYKFFLMMYALFLANETKDIHATYSESKIITIVTWNMSICVAVGAPMLWLYHADVVVIFGIAVFFIAYCVHITLGLLVGTKMYYLHQYEKRLNEGSPEGFDFKPRVSTQIIDPEKYMRQEAKIGELEHALATERKQRQAVEEEVRQLSTNLDMWKNRYEQGFQPGPSNGGNKGKKGIKFGGFGRSKTTVDAKGAEGALGAATLQTIEMSEFTNENMDVNGYAQPGSDYESAPMSPTQYADRFVSSPREQLPPRSPNP